jgi:hypothetical protein
MMEAARTSETLADFYQTTRRNNPEDSHLRTIMFPPGIQPWSSTVVTATLALTVAERASNASAGIWQPQDCPLLCEKVYIKRDRVKSF